MPHIALYANPYTYVRVCNPIMLVMLQLLLPLCLQVQEGALLQGYVANVTHDGVFVRFAGHTTGGCLLPDAYIPYNVTQRLHALVFGMFHRIGKTAFTLGN